MKSNSNSSILWGNYYLKFSKSCFHLAVGTANPFGLDSLVLSKFLEWPHCHTSVISFPETGLGSSSVTRKSTTDSQQTKIGQEVYRNEGSKSVYSFSSQGVGHPPHPIPCGNIFIHTHIYTQIHALM